MTGGPSAADPISPADRRLLVRALIAARSTMGAVGLSPPDGAALQTAEGRVRSAGQGRPGHPWAATALIDPPTPGATLALVLEPTPDRLEAVRAAGIPRILLGRRHPDPSRAGRFVQAARRAGLAVECMEDPRIDAVQTVYQHVSRARRPYVVLKMATSLDGRIATRTGESQWITQSAARALGRRLRGRLSAILVGVDTVLADDPRLTARVAQYPDPVRVVLDSRLRTPATAAMVRSARQVPTVVLTTDQGPDAARQTLEQHGVQVVRIDADPAGRVCVQAAVGWLFAQGLPSVLVEGGGRVHGAFIDAGLVDRVVWFGAPLLLGGAARPAVAGAGPARLSEALRFGRWTVRRIGPDWVVDAERSPSG